MDIRQVANFMNEGYEPIKRRTRYRDCDDKVICIGDWIHVQEYPDDVPIEKWAGSLDFEGRVEEREGKIVVTYYDIGEMESIPLSCFKKNLRKKLTEEEVLKI